MGAAGRTGFRLADLPYHFLRNLQLFLCMAGMQGRRGCWQCKHEKRGGAGCQGQGAQCLQESEVEAHEAPGFGRDRVGAVGASL